MRGGGVVLVFLFFSPQSSDFKVPTHWQIPAVDPGCGTEHASPPPPVSSPRRVQALSSGGRGQGGLRTGTGGEPIFRGGPKSRSPRRERVGSHPRVGSPPPALQRGDALRGMLSAGSGQRRQGRCGERQRGGGGEVIRGRLRCVCSPGRSPRAPRSRPVGLFSSAASLRSGRLSSSDEQFQFLLSAGRRRVACASPPPVPPPTPSLPAFPRQIVCSGVWLFCFVGVVFFFLFPLSPE